MSKGTLKLPHGYRPQRFNPAIDYTSQHAPETHDSFNQDAFAQLCDELEMHEEEVAVIESWVDEQIKLGMREFLFKFTNKMSHSLHGFCVLRALGYHAHIEDNKGKQITSLRAIAKHFECSHQYVDKLTKDLEQQLGLKVGNLQIEQKTYSMKVIAPKGWMTIGQVLKKYKVTRKTLWQLLAQHKVKPLAFQRKSKIVKCKTIDEIFSKESINGQNS